MFSVLTRDSHPRIAFFLKTAVYSKNMQIDRQTDRLTDKRKTVISIYCTLIDKKWKILNVPLDFPTDMVVGCNRTDS